MIIGQTAQQIKSQRRYKDAKVLRMRTLPFLFALSFPALAVAAPDGGIVSAGSAGISQLGATTLITQSSNRAVINWNNFSVGSGETVRFAQPNTSAITLNRVTGSTPSSILGSLQANGNVFLLNPNGIVFGAGAQVNVAGLVASTHSLSDADFMAGRFNFSGVEGGTGSVVNEGSLTAADGGYIALLAPQVYNRGVISARLGTVLLAGSDAVTLTFGTDGILNYKVDRGALNALVENHQLIMADGGQVYMTAIAASSLTQSMVRQDGVIEARTLENHGGTIRLLADMTSGSVEVGGKLDASGDSTSQNSNCGNIETSGAHVHVADSAQITTAGTGTGQAGQWLIDPNDFTIATSGGDITPTALAAQLASTNVTIASASGGTSGNGDIFVNNALNWTSANTLTLNAIRNISINAAVANTVGGSLLLRSDLNGTGTGTVLFGSSGSVALSGGGRTDIYYNPASFASPTSFTSKVSGTFTAWMLVNNITALQNISTNLAGTYALGTDIDASATASWNSNAGFLPLGTFTGKLDGLGHTVTGLTISRSSSNSVALFDTNQGTLSNFALSSASVTGNGNTSILSGTNQGTINNVNVNGALNGGYFSGGLTGDNLSTGIITNSSATLTFNSTAYINGTAAGSNEGAIRNVITAGSLSANADTIGGLVGKNNTGAILDNSHSAVNISSNSYNVGGAVGSNSGTVTNTYATGNINVNGSNAAGGLVGTNASGGYIAFSYSTGMVSGNSALGGLVATNSSGAYIGDSYATGTVSGGTVLGGLAGTNAGNIVRSWTSSNVTGSNAGGFVSSNAGTISNSYATGIVTGGSSANIGGFASQNLGTLTSDYSTGNTTGAYWLGGLVGTNTGTITSSYATGNITGTAGGDGGLVGVNASGATISGSYASGTVKGTDTLGGLVGDNSGTISNSYTTGAVQSTADTVGGLVGKNEGSGNVSYAYAYNTVTANSNFAGAFGTNQGSATSVYWNKTTSGLSAATSTGSSVGVTGLTTAQFTSTANFSGFNFSTYWRIYGGHTVPLLRSFLTPLTVTADAIGKVYDGSGYTGGLVNPVYSLAGATTSGHLLGVSTAYNTTKNAGVYAADLYTDGQQGYDITIVNGTYTIQKATLTLGGGSAASKTYDGTTTTSVTGTLSGIVSGDTVSILNGQFADKNAAAGKSVTVALTGTDSSNYSLTQPGLTATIYKAVLNVGAAAANKTYDGSVSATATYSDNRIAGDSLSVSGTATFANKNVGTGKTVTANSIVVSGTDAGNYTWNSSASSTASITQAALSLSGGSAASRTYDGTTNTIVSGTLSGLVSGDAVSITGGQFTDKNAGSGKAVSVLLAGSDLSNYSFSQPMLAADIYKAVLTVGASASNKVYDGSASASATYSDNRISGDSLGISGTAAFADKNAGTGKTVTVNSIGVTGTDAANYTWNSSATTTASISKAALSLTGGNAASRTYDGTTTTTVSGTLSGLVSGDAVSISSGQFADKNADTGKTVSVLLAGSDLSNYNFSQPALVADIYKAVLNIGATATDKIYDGSVSDVVAYHDNRINGDSLLVAGTAAFADANVGIAKTVTVHNIGVTGTDAGNYTWNTSATSLASITAAATPPNSPPVVTPTVPPVDIPVVQPVAVAPGPVVPIVTPVVDKIISIVGKTVESMITTTNITPTSDMGAPDSQGRTSLAKEKQPAISVDGKIQTENCEGGKSGSGQQTIPPKINVAILVKCEL